ncbi:hypothetical protein MMC26_002652 [Xylographa opegraphella]|nr:hypothetical protein [Xylographa opegraphella]
MPGRSRNPQVDTSSRAARNSVGIDVRFESNRRGISNRRASANPLPIRPADSGRDLESMPDHSSSDGQAQVDGHPVGATDLSDNQGLNNGTSDLSSDTTQSPVFTAGSGSHNATSALLNAGSGRSEARGRFPLRSFSIYSSSRAALESPTPLPPIQTDRFSFSTVFRRLSRDNTANTSPSDERLPGFRSPSIEIISAMNSVDFRELEYVNQVDQNLVCPICRCVMIVPVETACGHAFCANCLRLAIAHQRAEKSCPSCRSRFQWDNLGPVNKLVDRMLDELVVRCVSKSRGCLATLARSNVEDHVNRHCGFSDVPCPDTSCRQVLQRRQMIVNHCQHRSVTCKYCPKVMPELDLEEHIKTRCVNKIGKCRECKQEMHMDQAEEHKSICREVIVQCGAASYGCTFSSKRKAVHNHTAVCPLFMLRPYLGAQQTRLERDESVLKRMLRQNNIYKEFMANVEEVLAQRAPSPMPGVPPYHGLSHSNQFLSELSSYESVTQLLALYQSLREDVARVRTAISEVDARASNISINDNMRHAEEMSRLNATIAALKTQVQSILTAQRQRNEQRALGSQSSGGSGQLLSRPQEGTSTDLNNGGLGLGSIRRRSDPNRNDPKL